MTKRSVYSVLFWMEVYRFPKETQSIGKFFQDLMFLNFQFTRIIFLTPQGLDKNTNIK